MCTSYGSSGISSNRMQEKNTLSDRPAVSPSRKDTTMSHIDELRAAAADDSRFTAVAYEIAFGDRRVRMAELREIAATLIGTEARRFCLQSRRASWAGPRTPLCPDHGAGIYVGRSAKSAAPHTTKCRNRRRGISMVFPLHVTSCETNPMRTFRGAEGRDVRSGQKNEAPRAGRSSAPSRS